MLTSYYIFCYEAIWEKIISKNGNSTKSSSHETKASEDTEASSVLLFFFLLFNILLFFLGSLAGERQRLSFTCCRLDEKI